MTYGQAKKDFVIFAVFAPKKNKKGKTKWEEVDLDKETIPDEAEGQIGAYEYYTGGLVMAERLCFLLREER